MGLSPLEKSPSGKTMQQMSPDPHSVTNRNKNKLVLKDIGKTKFIYLYIFRRIVIKCRKDIGVSSRYLNKTFSESGIDILQNNTFSEFVVHCNESEHHFR